MNRFIAPARRPDIGVARAHDGVNDTIAAVAVDPTPAPEVPAVAPAARRPRTGPYQRVRLRSWPEMRALPRAALPTIARICALIARRPSAAYLVAARLHEPTDTVLSLLDDLRDSGHVEANDGVLSLPFAIEAHDAEPARRDSRPDPSRRFDEGVGASRTATAATR